MKNWQRGSIYALSYALLATLAVDPSALVTSLGRPLHGDLVIQVPREVMERSLDQIQEGNPRSLEAMSGVDGVMEADVATAADEPAQQPPRSRERTRADRKRGKRGGAFQRKLVEGFTASPAGLPANIAPYWDSSVLILNVTDNGTSIGTGFLVNKVVESGKTYGFFMTNHHVIDGVCAGDGRCLDTTLLNDVVLDANTAKVSRQGDRVVKLQGARLVKKTSKPDLALLKVELTAAAEQYLRVLPVDIDGGRSHGETVYAIGYPATDARTSPRMKPIENQNLIMKRWSVGIYDKQMKWPRQGAFLIHTADILPGNSGSPLLSGKTAQAVGVNVAAFFPTKDNDYTGGGKIGCINMPNTMRAAVPGWYLKDYMALAKP